MAVNLLGEQRLSTKNYANLIKHNEKDKATHLNVWDKFCDLFRKCKKSDVVNTFYNLIHGDGRNHDNSGKNAFYHFEQLRHMADPDDRHLFTTRVAEINGDENKYIFLIDNVEIATVSVKSWDALYRLEHNSQPLIDNYEKIVYDYVKENKSRFLDEYKQTKIADNYGSDELMDYSCFFLNNHSEVKKTLLERGIINIYVMDEINYDMDKTIPVEDNRRGYALTTIAGSLRTEYHLDGDAM
ncbi:hypothetical protein [Candidatus Symbiopectobacterium sp. NZEC151]|uniref:hypothetical protein n=2 Tax=unclassified Symbiopectobacterium TaxID=2794573 RepID=UPI002225EA82|nr:hypothetical protein [Candidatus Symbiopectobacterium sp. NZEC151]MCW2476525.1 hypothetical protein [Candidatus Symbiopectobacterium sp. NZEC151]